MTRVIPLGFQTSIKTLRVERVKEKTITVKGTTHYGDPCTDYFPTPGHWRIWLMANGDFSLGTFIQLCDNGTINRVTWHEDGTETVFEVTDEET